MDRRLDRGVGGLAKPADRRVLHGETDLIEKRDLLGYAAECLSAGDSIQCLLLANGADAARDTLAARFVAEERRDAQQNVRHVSAVVEHDDHAGAERGLRGARALEGERHVELVRRDEYTGRAAKQNRLNRPA